MHVFLRVLVLGCAFLGNPVSGKIIQTSNLVPMEQALQTIDESTLVIFDVDDVLTIPQDEILLKHNKHFLEKMEKQIEGRVGKNNAEKLWSLILMQRQTEPVDSKMISILSNLQSQGIKVLALTNCGTGPYGHILHIEDWRITELETLGYHFKNSWPHLKSHFFNHLAPKNPSRLPLFKDGIIFTADLPKGVVLKAFLDYAGFYPKKIIFIDDKEKHLKSVEDYAQSIGLEFLGFEYRGAFVRPQNPLNKQRAELQFRTLEKTHVWPSDEEAA